MDFEDVNPCVTPRDDHTEMCFPFRFGFLQTLHQIIIFIHSLSQLIKKLFVLFVCLFSRWTGRANWECFTYASKRDVLELAILRYVMYEESSVDSMIVDFDIIKVVSERHLFSAFTLILPCVNTVTDSYQDILSKSYFLPRKIQIGLVLWYFL